MKMLFCFIAGFLSCAVLMMWFFFWPEAEREIHSRRRRDD